jgi:hypothetical protein
MLDDQGVAKPLGLGLDVLINPRFGLGSERAKQENGAFIANQNVRGIRDYL